MQICEIKPLGDKIKGYCAKALTHAKNKQSQSIVIRLVGPIYLQLLSIINCFGRLDKLMNWYLDDCIDRPLVFIHGTLNLERNLDLCMCIQNLRNMAIIF